MAQNVSSTLPGYSGSPLRTDGRIELAFDRYLVPGASVRQSFVLHDLNNRVLTPSVAYDPVARVVTITPDSALQADQNYVISIQPSLRAVDGAAISPAFKTIEFAVVNADAGAPQTLPPTIDFCSDILPIFTNTCTSSNCHGGAAPAAGLRLDSAAAIADTAVGRVSQGSNTGPRATAEPPKTFFGVDMPIIDPGSGGTSGGDPGNSWLLYKLLLAVPSKSSSIMACDGGKPVDVSALHLVVQPAFADVVADPARAGLMDYVLGREMPFPVDPSASLEKATTLTIDQLERVSRWIAQTQPGGGGLVPPTCSCGP